LAALTAGAPREGHAEEAAAPPATADTLIVLWMAGGMAHTETFDPKRYAPYEKGMSPDPILSTFPSIPTAVDGIRFSEGLDKLASVMDRGTLIRTYTAGDLGKILHSRHQYHWHTGYAPPLTVAAPHIGSMVAKVLGPNHRAAAGPRRGRRTEGVSYWRFSGIGIRSIHDFRSIPGRGGGTASGGNDGRALCPTSRSIQ